ncbi:MAG: LysM peptidoglycan-binding domain-containing protein, partial [Thermodesulfobacteriota bacterium]
MKSFFLSIFLLFFISISLSSNTFSAAEHTVTNGDTLYEIAIKYKSTVSNFKKINNLNSNNLKIGQKLLIPLKAYNPESQIYTVQSGETLGGIANRFNFSSSEIMSYNGLKSSSIKAGQQIKIPSSNKSQAGDLKVKANEKNDSTTTKSEVVITGPLPEKNLALSDNILKPELSSNIKEKTENNQNSNADLYTVKSGDTISQIAEKLNVKTTDLKNLNGISNSKISIGQKLKVPGLYTPKAAPEIIESRPANYTVKKGDTLSQIAERFDVPVKNLKAVNGINSNKITVGKNLILPDHDYLPPPDIKKTDYKVKNGDTLSSISIKFDTTINTIKSLNSFSSNILKAGDTIYVPENKNLKTRNTVNYKVQNGDTLSTIANKFGVTVSTVKSLNNLSSSLIKKNQLLKIPSEGLSTNT